MKNSLYTLFFSVAVLISSHIKAQIPVNYIFTRDSLKGFDEQTANMKALQNNCFGQEYKSYMYKAKRDFVIQKYNLSDDITGHIVWTSASTASIQPGCSNVGFETGDFTGWSISRGSNSNSTTMAGCCPLTTGYISTVINATGNDPVAGALLPLTSPFAGSKIAKLNNATADYSVERMSQTFGVTASNAVFQFAYAGVLQAAGHTCTDQPYMNVTVLDSANNVLACPQIVIVAPSTTCSQPPANTAGWIAGSSSYYYHQWEIKTIDLSPYIGTNITIQITVGDCNQGGHYGYGYFDCKCNPLEITTNGTVYDAASQDSVYISPCGNLAALISAPDGLGPYTWEGPAGSGITGVTTQTISTNFPGTYTVTMNPAGSCTGLPIVKKAILRITPTPTATSNVAQPTCSNATGTGQITVVGGTLPYTYSWTPVASNSGIANGLTPGESYTIIVTDSLGCKDTTSLSVNPFPDAPTFTITPLNGVITCNTPSLTLTAITGTNTTGVWTGTTTPAIDVTNPGTYTVVLTNTVSVGQCSTTVNVTVTGDTIRPTAVPVVSCNSATISLNATSQPGVALGWLAPTTGGATPVGNPGTSTAIGVYTLTATNLNTGCRRTYTISTDIPDISVATTPSTNSITCLTPTVQAMTTSTNGGVTVTWLNGTSTSTANPYPITTPGTYTTIVTALGGCSTQSVIAVTQNTTANVGISSITTTISCATGNLDLLANSSGGNYTYTWTPATPSPYVGNPYNVTNAGTYTVMALNSVNGCTATASYAVTHESVTASFTSDPLTGLMPLSVNFTNTSFNGTSFQWNLGNSVTTTSVNANTVYQTQGTYTVQLIVTNGVCQDTATTIIVVDMVSFITIPNVFTPNGDGKNDIFSLNPINIGDISMTIFDRWGLKMFDTTSTGSLTWDGKTKGGTDVADGTYFYIIKAKGLDGKDFDFKGTVNIFR